LGGDGLALALFLGGDTEIEGDGHAHRCGSVGEKKQVVQVQQVKTLPPWASQVE
jgi:hypothetical protein